MTDTTARGREILERLVGFPTVSRDSNLPLIDWAEDYLAGHGVRAHRVWNADRTKAALFAQVGPDAPGGVVLSGHTDVVPVDGQDWRSDPWTLTERDGRLYGRGTCDMKGFCALALAAVPSALAAGLRRPLQIALSYDEEVGCLGAPPMIAGMGRTLPPPAAVIVGEPSMMQVVSGQKGSLGLQLRIRGLEVHSSRLPEGVSAIHEARHVLDWVAERNARNAAATPDPRDAGFDPPWTTLHVGLMSGGTAANITAALCEMSMDIRLVPGETMADWEARVRAMAADLDAALRKRNPACGVEVARAYHVPPLGAEANGAAEALARALTGDNGQHVVSYGTEGGQFQQAGHSTIICGPGDIAQAHKPDEFLSVEQLHAGAAFMDRLVARLAA